MTYRDSHLGKGADYDLALARDPFDAYMVRRERDIVLALLARLQRAGARRLLRSAVFRVRRTYGIGLWIYGAKLEGRGVLNSGWAVALELLSRIPFLDRFCPDAVILAQRS